MAPTAPVEEVPRRGLRTMAGVVGVLVVLIGATAAFGGLRGAPAGPVKATAGQTIDQGPFTVVPLSARTAFIQQFSGPAKNVLIVTARVTNTSTESFGVITFLDGIAAEPRPGRYVSAETMDSTGVIAGAKTSEIHPRMPIDVQLVWALPANTTLRNITVAFRKWSYGQSYTSDVFAWTVTKTSPVTAEVTLPVRPGGGS